jgi:hypothetical protein
MMAAAPRHPLPVPAYAELKSKYLALQQDADFALWRAREGNLEVRKAYAAHCAGDGPVPTPAQLEELRLLEITAEAKYRELRDFLRAHFDERAVAPA